MRRALAAAALVTLGAYAAAAAAYLWVDRALGRMKW